VDDLAIIDRFTETFSRYIDSGFGLLAGDVAFLTSILVAIDITLAGLFWALMGEDNIVAQLIRTCDRAVFLNARVYVMAQCKGHAGTLLLRSNAVATCCRIESGSRRAAAFTRG